MMRSLVFGSVLMAVVGVLWACGSDEAPAVAADDAAPPSPDAGPASDASMTETPVPATPGASKTYCGAIFGNVVRTLDACCTAEDKTTDLYELSNGFGSLLAMRCETNIESAIAKGRLLHRPGKAAECTRATDALYGPSHCTSLTELDAGSALLTCDAVFAGAVPSGGACAADFECMEGLTCLGWTSTSDGACAPPAAIDAPCGRAPSDGGLFDGLQFLRFGAHPACVEGARCVDSDRRCHTVAPVGGSCTGDAQCQSGLVCSQNICATRREAGAECGTNRDCREGTFCDQRVVPNVCTAKRTAGSSCFDPNLSTQCIGRCASDGGVVPGTCVSHCGSR